MSFKRFHTDPSSARCKSFAQAVQQAGKQQLIGQLASNQMFHHSSHQEETTMPSNTHQPQRNLAITVAQAAESWTMPSEPCDAASGGAKASLEAPKTVECLTQLCVEDDICLDLLPDVGLALDIPGPLGSGGLT